MVCYCERIPRQKNRTVKTDRVLVRWAEQLPLDAQHRQIVGRFRRYQPDDRHEHVVVEFLIAPAHAVRAEDARRQPGYLQQGADFILEMKEVTP